MEKKYYTEREILEHIIKLAQDGVKRLDNVTFMGGADEHAEAYELEYLEVKEHIQRFLDMQ